MPNNVVQLNRCRRKRRIEGRLHMRSALPDDESQIHEVRFLPGAVVNGFFTSVLSFDDSDTMRYVSGGVLNNPVTRASQSRGGGRIPRAGWLIKSGIVRRDDMAPRVINRAQSETAVLTRLGCALLQHSPRVSNDSNQRVDRGDKRRTGVDQGAGVPARLLVQRPSVHRQRHPRPSGELSIALPGLQGNTPAHKRFQGLGVNRSMPAIWSE